MYFRKNELIEDVLNNYYKTFSMTHNVNFVPEKIKAKIVDFVAKDLNKKLKETEIYYLLWLEDCGAKLGWFDRFRIWFFGKRQIYDFEKEEQKKLNNVTCEN